MSLIFLCDSGHAFGTVNTDAVDIADVGGANTSICAFPELDSISFNTGKSSRQREKIGDGRFKRSNHFVTLNQTVPSVDMTTQLDVNMFNILSMSFFQNRHVQGTVLVEGTDGGTSMFGSIGFVPYNKSPNYNNQTTYGSVNGHIGTSGDAYGFDLFGYFGDTNTTTSSGSADILAFRHGACVSMSLNQTKESDLTCQTNIMFRSISNEVSGEFTNASTWIDNLLAATFPDDFAGFNDASTIFTDEDLTIDMNTLFDGATETAFALDETWDSLTIDMDSGAETRFSLGETFAKNLQSNDFMPKITLNGEFKVLDRMFEDFAFSGTFTWDKGSGTLQEKLQLVFPNLKLEPFAPNVSVGETTQTLIFDATSKGTLPPVIVNTAGQYIDGIKFFS